MIIRKCTDTAQVYGDRLLDARCNGDILCINQLRLKVGDKVCFVINNNVYEGYITDFEKFWNGESYCEIERISVDNEDFSIFDIIWIGIE